MVAWPVLLFVCFVGHLWVKLSLPLGDFSLNCAVEFYVAHGEKNTGWRFILASLSLVATLQSEWRRGIAGSGHAERTVSSSPIAGSAP